MKHWDIHKTTFKVTDFINLQRFGDLELSPSFQRRPVWNTTAKSYLIDTVVRGLPIPIIILREKRIDLDLLQAKREVVDGQQRIRTILSFVAASTLKDFQSERDEFVVQEIHNEDVANKTFAQLTPEIQDKILNYELSVHILPARVDDREVLQLFARLNATGINLNPQELRNAEFQGAFKTLMYELAGEQLNRWRNWGIFSEMEIARMDEVDLTSEIAVMMLKGIGQKDQKILNSYYRKYDLNFDQGSEVGRRFRIVMDSIESKIGSQLRNTPFNRKTLIYSLVAFFYDLQFGAQDAPYGQMALPLQKSGTNPIKATAVARVLEVADSIANKSIDENTLKAITGKPGNANSRRAFVKYLHGLS